MKKRVSRLLGMLCAFALLCCAFPAEVPATSLEYADQLRAAGFPESYISALSALHEQYPLWEFEAVDTGLDWSEVVANESASGVNLVQKSANDSRKSTAEGDYDWATDTWTVYDSSSWVGANSDYIAYYLDPRNFLNDTDIFQFESLSYRSTQTKEGVEAILLGTFMANPVTDTDGTTLNYAQAFVDIGAQVGVSPYHLATRVRQEQGLKGTSSMISGTYSGYEGYFNYFNVGASGTTSAAVIKSGLAYAKASDWSTRYASLLGGARLLAEKYIAVGQDTLYFQKFNVVYTQKLYTHQYMQNVAAAYSEGKKLGQGYEDKQQAFVFRIPVYSNMPESAVTFEDTGNPNNYLKSITVSGQSLTPAFDYATVKYKLTVAGDVDSITVAAASASAKATVTGVGKKTLQDGKNTIKIKCTSESGQTRTYKLIVTKEASDEPSVSSDVYQIGDSQITGIAPGTAASDFLKNLTVKNGTVRLADEAGAEVTALAATANRLVLYDADGKESCAYELVLYGDVNGDGAVDILDATALNAYLLGTQTLTGSYLAAADTNRAGDGVNVLDLVYLNRHLAGTALIVP